MKTLLALEGTGAVPLVGVDGLEYHAVNDLCLVRLSHFGTNADVVVFDLEVMLTPHSQQRFDQVEYVGKPMLDVYGSSERTAAVTLTATMGALTRSVGAGLELQFGRGRDNEYWLSRWHVTGPAPLNTVIIAVRAPALDLALEGELRQEYLQGLRAKVLS